MREVITDWAGGIGHMCQGADSGVLVGGAPDESERHGR
jgi:hypothetical protein